ncbi:hypothetical protein AgCh_024259 [Apium graveolens]
MNLGSFADTSIWLSCEVPRTIVRGAGQMRKGCRIERDVAEAFQGGQSLSGPADHGSGHRANIQQYRHFKQGEGPSRKRGRPKRGVPAIVQGEDLSSTPINTTGTNMHPQHKVIFAATLFKDLLYVAY